MKISEIIEKNKDAILLIDIFIPESEGSDKGKLSVRGTGFIISSDGKFITNAHVYDQIAESERQYLGARLPSKIDEKGITTYDRYKIRFLKKDEENDIVLLEIQTKEKKDFSTVSGFGDYEIVREGDEVVFVGYPLATELLGLNYGITMSANRCIISSVKRRSVDGSLHFFFVDTHTNNGSSGSPVFEEKTGKIIGIVSGKISHIIQLPDGKKIDIPANMGICRPAKYIENLVKS